MTITLTDYDARRLLRLVENAVLGGPPTDRAWAERVLRVGSPVVDGVPVPEARR